MHLKHAFAVILLISTLSSFTIFLTFPHKAQPLQSFWRNIESLSLQQRILDSVSGFSSIDSDTTMLDIPIATHKSTELRQRLAFSSDMQNQDQGKVSMGKRQGFNSTELLHPKLLTAKIPFEVKQDVGGVVNGSKVEGHRLAVIVPFRAWTNCSRIDPEGVERKRNLAEFLFYLRGFLEIQEVEFMIVVVEQEEESRVLFNRGALFNVGVDLVQNGFDYLALHDADQIPLSEHNTYQFPDAPVHLCTYSTQYLPRPRGPDMLGGAVAIQTKHFVEVNGYSNMFWSVGLEDQSFYNRIKAKFGRPRRLGSDAGRYHALPHRKSKILRASRLYKYSERVLRDQISGIRQPHRDGLSTVDYTIQHAQVVSNDVLRIKVSLSFAFTPKTFYTSLSTVPR